MAFSEAERRAMARALELARRGPRSRNPQVGAVILSPEGAFGAVGWHHGGVTAHAEIDALAQLPAGAACGTTAVVTLEPCNHTGRTGPCAQALIDAGVARVVYALDDPGEVEGGGRNRLRRAGIEVEGGLLAERAAAFLAPWLTARALGRPHVTVKWAQSLDGRAAAADGTSTWITGPAARADVHARRAEADAIIAGTGTVVADDPALTARDGDSLRRDQPVPVIVGERGIPEDAAVRRHPRTPLFHRTHDLRAVLADLHDRGLHRVFVEGGPTLASAFIAAGLVDRLLVYVAPTLIGGGRLALTEIGVATIAEQRRLVVDEVVRLGDDTLFIAAPAGTGHAGRVPTRWAHARRASGASNGRGDARSTTGQGARPVEAAARSMTGPTSRSLSERGTSETKRGEIAPEGRLASADSARSTTGEDSASAPSSDASRPSGLEGDN
jgi:diaminohydroxyphosphoribosylaminopyrimidine deaminase/5-amino-6-(5-phosphoribosylamino)uracil reductase